MLTTSLGGRSVLHHLRAGDGANSIVPGRPASETAAAAAAAAAGMLR